jgi:hypothetical protein
VPASASASTIITERSSANRQEENTIERVELAEMLGISVRTLRRRETNLPIQRIRGTGKTVLYQRPNSLQWQQLTNQASGDIHRQQEPRMCWMPRQERLRQALQAQLEAAPDVSFELIEVTIAWALRRQMLHADPDGSFQVSARTHDRLVGSRKGRRIREMLSAAEIWQKTRPYWVGNRCFGYKLANWCCEDAEKRELSWPEFPKSRKARSLAATHAAAGVTYPLESVQHIEASLGCLHLPAGFDVESIIEDNGVVGSRALKWRMATDRFSANRAGCTVARYSGRLFHKASHLPKPVRRLLEFSGQATVEVDISNCQPLLMAVYFRDHAQEMGISKQDQTKLLDVTSDGEFYRFLKATPDLAGIEDSAFKAQVCQDLLFGWKHFKHTPIFRVFSDLVPTAARAVQQLHARDLRMAMLLQRMEVTLMFGSIVPHVIARMRDLPFVSIHDALIVPIEAGREVSECLKDAAQLALGVRPKVKLGGQGVGNRPIERNTEPNI